MTTADIGFRDPDILARIGPTIAVHIAFDPSFRSAAEPASQPVEEPGFDLHPALVDTGAAHSCIDSGLDTALDLPIVEPQWISGATGASEVNVYAAQINIPSLGRTMPGEFHGVELTAGGQPHFALIGRSFLKEYTLVYNRRTGRVTLSSQ